MLSPRWSKEDDQILITFYGTKTAKELASQLSVPRTDTAVENRLQKLRKQGRILQKELPWKPEEKQEAIKLCGNGLTYAEIGKTIGRSEVAVQKQLSRLGEGKIKQGLNGIDWQRVRNKGFAVVSKQCWPVQGVLRDNTIGIVIHPTLLRNDSKKFIKKARYFLGFLTKKCTKVTRINFIEASSPEDFYGRQNKRRSNLIEGFVLPSPESSETFKAWMIADGSTRLESNNIYTGELVQIFTLLVKNNASHAEYMLNTFKKFPEHELTTRALTLERLSHQAKNPKAGQPLYGWKLRLSLNNWSIFKETLADFYSTSSDDSSRNYKRMPSVDILVNSYLTSNRVLALVYMQDGGLMHTYKTVKLTINSIYREACCRLAVALYKVYNLRFILYESKDSNRNGQYRCDLFLCAADLETFVNLINPAMDDCMRYKMPPKKWFNANRSANSRISPKTFDTKYPEYEKVAFLGA